ncbi:MAG: sulfurtransferase TusA family protein [Alphaproteobacteria bacterium]|nr:sulfurtransferase TusA family protein [Alphaproteobacteria bacterium]
MTKIDYFLDITRDVCPMTFVRTRLLIEKVASGAVIEVRLNGGEPLGNVPDSVAELGHAILGVWDEAGNPVDRAPPPAGGGPYRLRIRKA